MKSICHLPSPARWMLHGGACCTQFASRAHVALLKKKAGDLSPAFDIILQPYVLRPILFHDGGINRGERRPSSRCGGVDEFLENDIGEQFLHADRSERSERPARRATEPDCIGAQCERLEHIAATPEPAI